MTTRELVTNSVRNENGIFINSQVFREEGKTFHKTGRYCVDPKGTLGYIEYWDEQLKRCKEGYSVGGVKITNHHYFYLNFTQIKIVEETGDATGIKVVKTPDFWDGDYAYFWAVEIARNGLFTKNALAPSTQAEREQYKVLQSRILVNPTPEDIIAKNELENKVIKRLALPFKIEQEWLDGGHHLIIGKSRRKGYSYKDAAICSNTYNTQRNSLCLIGAFDKKFLYPRGTMGMVSEQLDFLNANTAFTKSREAVNKQEHKRASFLKTIEGATIEAGYMSEVMAITFKDNPHAARGKDASIVLLEEAGSFPNLRESYRATEPGLSAGKYITGQIIVFGTGGDMEYGTTDFADMFYHPTEYNAMPFINIWDEDAENSNCGFFHPVTWNMEGFYDEQGNSDIKGATKEELKTREKMIKSSTSSMGIQARVQEFPFNPSEAFLTVSMNDFPVVELRNRFNKVVRDNLHIKLGTPVHLVQEEGQFRMIPDLEDQLQPLWTYKIKTKDITGSPVIFEPPISNPPKGLYKIGFDPYRQFQADNSSSLAAIYVYKANNKFTYTRDTIVAQYIGRPRTPDDVNRIAEAFAELYHAEIMFENEVTHVRDYFTRRKRLNLLAAQPDTVINKAINASTVNRTYGIHMTEKLKDAGEKYIKQWLLAVKDYDEKGNPILNLDTLTDPALIEELIFYNRKGNFDRVMAFMMIMFQIAEDEDGKTYDDKPKQTPIAQQLMEMMQRQYKNAA